MPASCANYADIVTDVLLDASGGLGHPLDPATVATYLEAIDNVPRRLGTVVAGKLYANAESQRGPSRHSGRPALP